ncbi:MAG: RNA polymerase sigma factor, partial [Woeseia sp.]
LLTDYEKPVYNAAFRMLGNRDDAADVTQSAFMKAFEKIASFNSAHRFFSWIYRITMNEAIDQLQRRGRMQQVDVELVDENAAPQREVDASQVSDEIQAALLELNDDHRAVIVLHYFSDCNYQQIAETLDIPEKTVKSRLFSARQQLKLRLARHGIFSL